MQENFVYIALIIAMSYLSIKLWQEFDNHRKKSKGDNDSGGGCSSGGCSSC